jgi:hypothetical protein
VNTRKSIKEGFHSIKPTREDVKVEGKPARNLPQTVNERVNPGVKLQDQDKVLNRRTGITLRDEPYPEGIR